MAPISKQNASPNRNDVVLTRKSTVSFRQILDKKRAIFKTDTLQTSQRGTPDSDSAFSNHPSNSIKTSQSKIYARRENISGAMGVREMDEVVHFRQS